jgi:hypothetical protein
MCCGMEFFEPSLCAFVFYRKKEAREGAPELFAGVLPLANSSDRFDALLQYILIELYKRKGKKGYMKST